VHLPPLQEPAEEPQLSMVCSREVSYTGTRINNGRRPKTWMAGMKSRCSDFTMNLHQTVYFFASRNDLARGVGGQGVHLRRSATEEAAACAQPLSQCLGLY
jgi:hypothetical protein